MNIPPSHILVRRSCSDSTYRIFVLVVISVLSFEASSASPVSIGSRSLLRSITDSGSSSTTANKDAAVRDVAIDLNATNFDEVLGNTPASFAVVEFFAHWCPACRNYKPHYEKVARLFNGPEAAHPGIILMARVDCASKINAKLCDRFSVSYYPMLLWGPPIKFLSGHREPKKDDPDIRVIGNGRTSEHLLDWINKQMGSSFSLDDEKYEHEHLQSNVSNPGQIARAIYDVEEATASAFDIILRHKMIKAGARSSLIRFLQLVVAHHPSRRCKKGSADILVNFDDLYPPNTWIDSTEKDNPDNANDALGNFQICGKEVPRGYWLFCRGSRNDTRGFSCGLWVLLHSMSVRIEDGESQMTFTTICDFVHNFFICEECRQHFYDMCSSVSTPFTKTQDFALWLWSAHNKVNERLMKEEASLGTGDPKFPKTIWPPRSLCASCYLPASPQSNSSGDNDWDRDQVFKFLASYYGRMLVSLYKDKEAINDGAAKLEHSLSDDAVASAHAVVVPVGAAVAIALASCAFGALACYWRSQQKSRKTRRSWS